MRPGQVKRQSFLLGEFQSCTKSSVFWWSFHVFLYGTILGFVKSHEVSSTQFSSSIGFTVVKNTACLPLLRLLPRRINPFLTKEFNSFAFPTWYMYSVNPFGNSTLSCNAGSIALSPECPWIAPKYEMCLEELGFKQHWNLFLASPPFARIELQSLSGHCETPRNVSLSICNILQQYLHIWLLRRFPEEHFDHVVAIWSLLLIWCSTHDHDFPDWRRPTFLSRRGTETGVSVIVDFIRGLALAIGFPKALCSSSSMVSVVSLTYFSTPFTIRNQEAVLSWNRDRTWISIR